MTRIGLSRILWLTLAVGMTSRESFCQFVSLEHGDHQRTIVVSELNRTYLVHVPGSYVPTSPTPVVLALHGAAMNGEMMVSFTGLNQTSDEKGFVVVYPSGTGSDPFLTWNAGGVFKPIVDGKADDIVFIESLLDDLIKVVAVDEKRIYACGMSNGGMMCYRLAAELSDRIAAIAPVAGTIAIEESRPTRAVPVIHFHGRKDTIVPFGVRNARRNPFMAFKGVEDSIQTWVQLDECDEQPLTDTLSKEGDAITVTRQTYGNGKNGSEVVLVAIDQGGHTWPGQRPPISLLGKSAMNISANDLMWDFFMKHPLAVDLSAEKAH